MKLPKYVQGFVDRETGRAYHYFRRTGSSRVPLPGLPWSPQFMAAYQEALDAAPPQVGAAHTRAGSLDAGLAQYYPSREFRSLKSGTQRLWRAIFERWRNDDGYKPLARLPREYIIRRLSEMKPHAARNWLKAIRHFLRFCVEHGFIATDPTLGIKLKTPSSDGHHVWTENEIAQFRATHPVGSKPRLALELGLYTTQRRGDVVRMGRQHLSECRDEALCRLGVKNMLFVRQEKTGTPLSIPIHPELQAIFDATPSNHLTFLTTKSGKGYGAGFFSDQFRKWCDDAGLPSRCVFHGLRKTALTQGADAGDTVHELAAFSGHRSLKEVERYTKRADQARLARAAMARRLASSNEMKQRSRRRARGE